MKKVDHITNQDADRALDHAINHTPLCACALFRRHVCVSAPVNHTSTVAPPSPLLPCLPSNGLHVLVRTAWYAARALAASSILTDTDAWGWPEAEAGDAEDAEEASALALLLTAKSCKDMLHKKGSTVNRRVGAVQPVGILLHSVHNKLLHAYTFSVTDSSKLQVWAWVKGTIASAKECER